MINKKYILVSLMFLLSFIIPRSNASAAKSKCTAGTGPCNGFINFSTNTIDSFTYNGTDPDHVTGTVYTLSTANDYLGFCQLTPSGSTSSNGTAECFTNYGPQQSPGYTAVAFLGTVQNPNQNFVVGDNEGSIFLANLEFDTTTSPYQVTSVQLTPNSQGFGCPGAVFNLAVDPNGKYLYVGCNAGSTALESTPNFKERLPSYQLYVVPIMTDGTLGDARLVTDIFPGAKWTTWWWMGVSPVMRAYPANSPNLKNSGYSESGAVMVSGLIGGLESNTAKGPGPVPQNTGLICSNGACGVAYAFVLQSSDSFSVMTAVESGVDFISGEYTPALYWNQVQGEWGNCNNSSYTTYDCESFNVPIIDFDSTSNEIYSCNINNSPIGKPADHCGGGSYSLKWPPNNFGGSSTPVDITNLHFQATPAPAALNDQPTPFPQGLLTIGTTTDGFLAYHAPSTENNSTELLFNDNGQSGQVGNVNSQKNDGNGNLLFSTTLTGLFAFNPFLSTQNVANGTDVTLIPNITDVGGDTCGLTCSILNVTKIAYNVVTNLELIAPAASGEEISSSVADAVTSAQELISGRALGKVLGAEPYHGQFLYTEAQLQEMGIEKGMLLRGLKLRSSEGITHDLNPPVLFKEFNLVLSSVATTEGSHELSLDFGLNMGEQPQVLRNGARRIRPGNLLPRNGARLIRPGHLPQNKVYPGSPGGGEFGRTLWFRKPYRYAGGDLLMEVTHRGRTNTRPILIDAFRTSGLQGVFKTLLNGGEPQAIAAIPAVEFVSVKDPKNLDFRPGRVPRPRLSYQPLR